MYFSGWVVLGAGHSTVRWKRPRFDHWIRLTFFFFLLFGRCNMLRRLSLTAYWKCAWTLRSVTHVMVALSVPMSRWRLCCVHRNVEMCWLVNEWLLWPWAIYGLPAALLGIPSWQPLLAVRLGNPSWQLFLAVLLGNPTWQPLLEALGNPNWQPLLAALLGNHSKQLFLVVLLSKPWQLFLVVLLSNPTWQPFLETLLDGSSWETFLATLLGSTS